MHELDDRWLLPIAGGTVTQCCVHHGLTIAVDSEGAAEATILISGAFDFQSTDGSWRLNPVGKAVELAPVLAILGQHILAAEAHKDGTLELAFDDGSRVRVPPETAYEAWEFDGSHGAKAIALPGGAIAIWRSAA